MSSPFVSGTKLQTFLRANGAFPKVTLQVKPIDNTRPSVEFPMFTDYSFQSSVLVPIDSFSFKLVNPTIGGSLYDTIKDGDIAILKANGTVLGTGLIDSVAIGTDPDSGEVVEIHGRTLIAQLEDQSCVNELDAPFWANSITIDGAINFLCKSTRVNYYRLQQVPSGSFLFATEPGESKMSSLLRFIEPLNCILWMDPDGTLVVGRPNMGAAISGTFLNDRAARASNNLSMKAVYSSTHIPNVVIPVWTGQETVQNRISPEQAVLNNGVGPSRLYKLNHRVPKTVVVSTPQGADPQALSQVNQLTVAGSNVLQAYAKREIARANVSEVGLQVNVKGHYNDDLSPIVVDTCYQVVYPRASINEKMYLHTVDYTMSRDHGQLTSMFFCRLGSIVADVAVQSQKQLSVRKPVTR